MKEPWERMQEYSQEASKRLDTPTTQIEYHCWPEYFGTCSGPRGGISGQAITRFQIFGFYSTVNDKAVKCCDGVWKDWNDQKYCW